MDPATMHKKLLYEHEVLWARYEIRDHHLKKIGEKIYDDVGQVLSLVRIQLCQLDGYSDLLNEDTYEPGELVSKAIRGLRAMHKSFHPETELLAKEGLVKTLEYELELLNGIKKADPIRINGQPQDLVNGTQLIVFRMLQEMLLPIIEQYSGPVAVTVLYEETAVRFVIEYAGSILQWDGEPGKKQAGESRLQLPMRAVLLGGSLQATAMGDDRICITLTVPFKTAVY
ncbi:MAG TPA: hypothetical protein VM010_07215, partial [Chitinophagaceae bacterium]|nr:hypothetical protein [Chitinophagaceae bacterium]